MEDFGIYEPQKGYDLAARSYESWHWLEFWKRNELPQVQQWVATQPPGTILDAGTGTGLYRSILESVGHFVVGVDISIEMLRLQAQKSARAALVQASLMLLPFRSLSLDYVLCTRVLSHIADVPCAFAEFARVTMPNARLFIADVHPEHRYSEMSIPTARGTVSIETSKHPMREIYQSAESSGFEVTTSKEFYLTDLLWRPPVEKFQNIYDEPTRPIFYTCSLRRR